MNYGLYLSASGVLTNLYRQDVLAHNLANAQSVGFKRDVPAIRHRDAESIESSHPSEFRRRLLDRMGGGALAGPQRVSLQRGAMTHTGQPLDVALAAENAFLAVQATDPATSQPAVRLTRDGRLTLDAGGQLVTAAGGHALLDSNDRPIVLDPSAGNVQIGARGEIWQAGEIVSRLQVTAAASPETLVKQGQGLLWFADGRDQRAVPIDGRVEPGHVESSAVDPITTLTGLIDVTREVTFNSQLIRYHDQLMDRAVNSLGRVA